MDIETHNKFISQSYLDQQLNQNNCVNENNNQHYENAFGLANDDFEVYNFQNNQEEGCLNRSINLGNFSEQKQNDNNQNTDQQLLKEAMAQNFFTEFNPEFNSDFNTEFNSEFNTDFNILRDNQEKQNYQDSNNINQRQYSNQFTSDSEISQQNSFQNLNQNDNKNTYDNSYKKYETQQSSQTIYNDRRTDDESFSLNTSSQFTYTQGTRQMHDQNANLKQVDMQVMPLLKNLSQREIYLIYGEILIEFDQIFESGILEKSSGYNQFKKVVNVQQRQNGYVEVIFNTFEKPLRDFKFLVQRLRNMPNQKAYQLSHIMEQYQVLVDNQIADIQRIKNTYPQQLINLRSEYCQKKSEELISMLDETANVLYMQSKMDPQTFEPQNFKQGFSRKLAWIFGVSPEVLSQLYMRYGQIDFAKCASKIEMAISKVLQSFNDMLKEKQNRETQNGQLDDLISQHVFKFDMQTIDDLTVPLTAVVSRLSLSQEFDQQYGIKGLIPEHLMIADIKVDLNYMHMLIKQRCESFPLSQDGMVKSFLEAHNIIQNEEYYNQSKNFIEKFYPKEDEENRLIQKPRCKRYTNNAGALFNNNNNQSNETLNQLYQIFSQSS